MDSIIFKTTHRKAVSTVVIVTISATIVEVAVTSVSTANSTTPVVTVTSLIVKRSIAVVTVTRSWLKEHKLHILVT